MTESSVASFIRYVRKREDLIEKGVVIPSRLARWYRRRR